MTFPTAGRESRSDSAVLATASSSTNSSYAVTCCATVFRIVRGELCVGLPVSQGVRALPCVAPDPAALNPGLDSATRQAAAVTVPAREIARMGPAGVRTFADGEGQTRLVIVSWGIARPLAATAATGENLEADECFVPLSALPTLDPTTRALLRCGFDAFLDVTLADALTRRLLPRNVLFRKTDGFGGRSPFERSLGENVRSGEPVDSVSAVPVSGTRVHDTQAHETQAHETHVPEFPVFVGLLPDPFPLSQLRDLYERLLGAPLDRGNFRRQFHEIIESGPIKALPIFERGVSHRAGQLFTFDRGAWLRFTERA